jgi:hypothetical protein
MCALGEARQWATEEMLEIRGGVTESIVVKAKEI